MKDAHNSHSAFSWTPGGSIIILILYNIYIYNGSHNVAHGSFPASVTPIAGMTGKNHDTHIPSIPLVTKLSPHTSAFPKRLSLLLLELE